jgi:ferritin-like metal-binding protein YciE
MNKSQQKIVQYLNEAHASEQALIRVLQSQLAMTPRGPYRSGLETHLRETRDHAARVAARL